MSEEIAALEPASGQIVAPDFDNKPPMEVSTDPNEFANYSPEDFDKAAKALGMKGLTKEKLCQYHQVGDVIQKVGPLKIGRTGLLQCIEGVNAHIAMLEKTIESYEGRYGNVEIDRIRADLFSQKSAALEQLQKLSVHLIRSASIDLDDEPAKRRAKPFAAGRPIVFANHATLNEKSDQK